MEDLFSLKLGKKAKFHWEWGRISGASAPENTPKKSLGSVIRSWLDGMNKADHQVKPMFIQICDVAGTSTTLRLHIGSILVVQHQCACIFHSTDLSKVIRRRTATLVYFNFPL